MASQSQSLPGEPNPLKSLADNFRFLWLGQEVQSDTCTLLMYIFVSNTYLLLGSVYNSMLLQQVFVCTSYTHQQLKLSRLFKWNPLQGVGKILRDSQR